MQGRKRFDHIEGFREELGDLEASDFFTFFNDSPDADASFVEGTWDFAISILAPLRSRVDSPHMKTVLEIGSGGGRLLYAATRAFQSAIGMDVHQRQDLVARQLHARGVENFALHTTDGSAIPVPDCTVDVIYSILVFQHMERLSIAVANLREAHRVLRPGGYALIYVGRRVYGKLDWPDSDLVYWLDTVAERLDPRLRSGVQEIPAQHVNAINLIMRLDAAVDLATESGFEVVSAGKPTGFLRRRGRQHRLLLRKPI